MRTTLVLLALLCALPARAAEIETLEVSRSKNLILVRSEIVLDAPQDRVFAALSDYDRFSSLSSRYKESRFIEPAPDGSPRVYTLIEGCVMFFCRELGRYARLELKPNVEIRARAEPGLSDVKYGYELWRLEPVGERTRVIYTHDMEPDFWVPPVIGIWAIRRVLRADGEEAAARLEALAREPAEPAQPSR